MSSQSELEEAVAPFLDHQFAVTLPLNTIIVTFIVYGIYIVIFGICVTIYRSPRQDPQNDRRNKIYNWSTFLLFGLATILVAFYTWDYYDQAMVVYDMTKSRDYEALLEYLAHDDVRVVRRGIISSTRTLICLIASVTVIHRCYTVWDSRKIIALPFLFASFCSTCVQLAASTFIALGDRDKSNAVNWDLFVKGNKMALSVEVFNACMIFLVTLLTAGRIWFISRQVRRLLGRQTFFMYRTVIAIILESGFLCPLAIMINLIIVHARDPSFGQSIPVDLYPVIYQFAGIAPTLVTTRARAGKSIESVDQTILSIHFATTHQEVEVPRTSIGGLPRDRDRDRVVSIPESWSQILSASEK